MIELPWCFAPNGDDSVHTFSPSGAYDKPHRALHNRAGNTDDLHGTIELQQGAFAEAGSDLPSLRFEATAWSPEVTRVRITTPEADRWEVPARLFPNNLQPPQRSGMRLHT